MSKFEEKTHQEVSVHWICRC